MTDYEPTRFALKRNPPAIVLEYRIPSQNKFCHRTMHLGDIKEGDTPETIVKSLQARNHKFIPPERVSTTQIIKLVELLLAPDSRWNKLKANVATNQFKNEQTQSRLPPTPPPPPRMKFTGERGPRCDGVLNFATWNMLADGMSYGEFMTDAGDRPVTVWPVRGPRVLDVCVEAMRSSAVLAVQENDHFFEILHALRESAIADGAGDVIQGGWVLVVQGSQPQSGSRSQSVTHSWPCAFLPSLS